MARINYLVHLFFPHQTNNHRAKALHIDALLTYILLFALFNLGLKALHRTIPDILGYATDIHVEQLLASTNAKRAEAGLAPLALNDKLSVAAANKATDMFAKNYWAHNSPTGATPWEFISGAGYRYNVAGENLAKNFSTSTVVVDAWMASATHRANIVKPGYKEVGFAVVNGILNGEETTLVVQMFGASAAAPVAVAPSPARPALPAGRPVVIPEAAAVKVTPALVPEPTTEPVKTSMVSGFQSVTKQPVFNIPTVTRDVVFAFMGIMMGILLVDAWVASRRHVVRIAGHNIAHMLFLGVLYMLVSSVGRGRLL